MLTLGERLYRLSHAGEGQALPNMNIFFPKILPNVSLNCIKKSPPLTVLPLHPADPWVIVIWAKYLGMLSFPCSKDAGYVVDMAIPHPPPLIGVRH